MASTRSSISPTCSPASLITQPARSPRYCRGIGGPLTSTAAPPNPAPSPSAYLRSAVLETPMLAAVDLHQLANALAPRPRLVNASALLAITPQPVSDHPLSQGLARERKAMLGGELFSRQSRPKISVIPAHDP